MRTAEVIGSHNKIMKNLVTQLAVERERLHQQISALSIENSVLVMRLKQSGKAHYVVNGNGRSQPERSIESCPGESRQQETLTSTTGAEDEKSNWWNSETELDDTESKSDNGTVRRLNAVIIGFKHIFIAILVLMLSGSA